MKIGRNDPCPCGSGKKYKECCLLKTGKPYPVIIDKTSKQMIELAYKHRNHFDLNYKKPVEELRLNLIDKIDHKISESITSDLLEIHLDQIEKKISQILSKHSKYYWLYLSRRIAPEPIEFASEWTAHLSRVIFNLAILKHGIANENILPFKNEFVIESGLVFPKSLSYKDCLNIYQVELLAYWYNAVTAMLRRIWKGGTLIVNGKDLYIKNTETQERLIQLYDDRVEKYHKLLSSFGYRVEFFPRIKELSKEMIILVPFLNVSRTAFPITFKGEKIEIYDPIWGEFRPNYIYTHMDLNKLFELASRFKDKIKELFGFTPKELILFLLTVCFINFLIIKDSLEARYHFFQRGYYIILKGELYQNILDDWAKFYIDLAKTKFNEIINFEDAKNIIVKIVKSLTYSKDDLNIISLWDKFPYKLFFETHEALVLDLSAIPFIFLTIFQPLASLSGHYGNIKGVNFEKEVKNLIKRVSNLELWECQKKLKTIDKQIREIDVSFIREHTLYVLDCKTMYRKYLIGRGDYTALQRRWKTLQEYFNKVRSLAKFLNDNPVGTNYKLPKKIKQIEPIVCTTFPEYIPTLEKKYWLDKRIPRVCTPEELIEYLNN